MNPKMLEYIVDELNVYIGGSIISKIHQPEDKTLILKLFGRGSDKNLLISTDQTYSRMYLTTEKFENPPRPPRFCAYLRSKITNAKIESVIQVKGQISGERIAEIRLTNVGDSRETAKLVIELTGKSGNVILTDKNDITMDALKYYDVKKNKDGDDRGFGHEPEARHTIDKRVVMPGIKLEPLNTETTKESDKYVFERAGDSWNESAEIYYNELVGNKEFEDEKRTIATVTRGAIKRAKRKEKNIKEEIKKHKETIKYDDGELLVANFHLLKKGMTEVEVDDYRKTSPVRLTIKLDSKKNPQDNIDSFFKKIKKARMSLTHLDKRVVNAEGDRKYLEETLFEIDNIDTIEDLSDIREALTGMDVIKSEGLRTKGEIKRTDKNKTDPVRVFQTTEGFQMLCGKNSKGNDMLVKKYGKKGDLWFHANNSPGSHVLLKHHKGMKDKSKLDKSILQCAALAAYYSKQRNNTKVEVIYTDIKNVNKPKGAKPGQVLVSTFKSALVKPQLPQPA